MNYYFLFTPKERLKHVSMSLVISILIATNTSKVVTPDIGGGPVGRPRQRKTEQRW
jgi:hypothetical protein